LKVQLRVEHGTLVIAHGKAPSHATIVGDAAAKVEKVVVGVIVFIENSTLPYQKCVTDAIVIESSGRRGKRQWKRAISDQHTVVHGTFFP